jgi:hypothetical protein
MLLCNNASEISMQMSAHRFACQTSEITRSNHWLFAQSGAPINSASVILIFEELIHDQYSYLPLCSEVTWLLYAERLLFAIDLIACSNF